MQEESNLLREEMAGLKRKLAEQAVRPVTGALPAVVPTALLTEVLPSVSDIFPEQRSSVGMAATLPPDPVTEPKLAIPSIPDLPETLRPERSPVGEVPIFRSRLRLKSIADSPASTQEEQAVEPFSFLLPEEDPDTADSMSPEDAESTEGTPISALSFILNPDSTAITAPVSAPPSVIPENDPVLGLIFKERPADVDNLTRLQGISPTLQNRLQELGIYRFQQIASWNHSHVREFSRRLAFKDRIERERWVEQARRFMDGELV
ncbi:hypothetical protein [Prosthecobacter dejongeii]|nr:hypothetical protein [Prosthecobacter dejongeii]